MKVASPNSDRTRTDAPEAATLDKSAVITLQVKRGDQMAFVTVSGLTDKG